MLIKVEYGSQTGCGAEMAALSAASRSVSCGCQYTVSSVGPGSMGIGLSS